MTALVMEKAFPILPNCDPKCCSACGMDCYQMTIAILKGEKQRTDCVADSKKDLRLYVNDREIQLVPFVQHIFRDSILAYIRNLKGADPDGKIRIEL